MSLVTTKKMKAELCSLWRLQETPFQLLALRSQFLAPGLLLYSNQQSLVEPFSHVTTATSHASLLHLLDPITMGGSTERIQDNQVLDHIVVLISVTPEFPHVCYVIYSNSRGEDTATFEHSAGLSFSLSYVQLAFPLAFFRTPRPITCP